MADSGRHIWLFKKYGVSSMPTVLFLDSEGKKVADLKSREASDVMEQMNEIADKHNREPKWAETEDAAFSAGKEEQKPVLIFFHDNGPKTEPASKAFGELPLADLLDRFVWVKKSVDAKSDEAKKLGLSSSLPALWVVDPQAEEPMSDPLKKIRLPKSGANLKSELTSALKSWEKKHKK